MRLYNNASLIFGDVAAIKVARSHHFESFDGTPRFATTVTDSLGVIGNSPAHVAECLRYLANLIEEQGAGATS